MRRNALARAVHHKRSLKQVWQLGDVARYASEFVDLVSRKAKQLGVEVRVERRLAAGDISLLSWLLATPLGAGLYKLSRGSQSEVVPPPGDVAP